MTTHDYTKASPRLGSRPTPTSRSRGPAVCHAAFGALVALAAAGAGEAAAQATLRGGELLDRAIRYHDPAGEWSTFSYALSFEESRPNGVVRHARVTLNLPGSGFAHESEREGVRVKRAVRGDECTFSVDGSGNVGPELAERYDLDCPSTLRSRNYYLYLWGLPMKLRDPGTRIDREVRRTRFMDQDVLALRVTYDAEVGSDIWYFYFDPGTYRMTGYRFYHDEAAGDGEYIVLEGEHRVSSMRIPARRTWYTNADDRLLGEDELVGHEAVPPS